MTVVYICEKHRVLASSSGTCLDCERENKMSSADEIAQKIVNKLIEDQLKEFSETLSPCNAVNDISQALTQYADEKVKEAKADCYEYCEADEAIQKLLSENERLKKQVEVMREALEPLVEDSECSFDHHGYCQEHGSLSIPCSNQIAKDALKRTEGESK